MPGIEDESSDANRKWRKVWNRWWRAIAHAECQTARAKMTMLQFRHCLATPIHQNHFGATFVSAFEFKGNSGSLIMGTCRQNSLFFDVARFSILKHSRRKNASMCLTC